MKHPHRQTENLTCGGQFLAKLSFIKCIVWDYLQFAVKEEQTAGIIFHKSYIKSDYA